MILSNTVMRGNNLCLLVATLALSYACARAEGMRRCQRGVSWWDRERAACAPCTRCDPDQRLAVRLPCELHRDTVCQPLFQIQLFPFETQNRTKSDTTSDYEDDYSDYESEVINDSEDKWDFQAPSVAIAASGCVVFFLVVLYLSLSHAKQWKVLKQTLQSDMQDLTAKMKLMEAGGESPTEPVAPASHHIYCNVHVGKEALLGPAASKKGFGNVYTQEKHPS
ncbi:tumor necrosis factor receptor superfamily member wengen [Ostrinia furnacalis]|uniref:tumor necrosis factor receptor superfamily member wengen n=1 Tax=Ostrinia furnacalis TaxID=93504 RepID=UPI001038FE2D|nr:tumor necrosis factor receptor superfamily member wengen [Ostrinia furnacalis]